MFSIEMCARSTCYARHCNNFGKQVYLITVHFLRARMMLDARMSGCTLFCHLSAEI